MSGLELLERLKTQGGGPPAIMITGHADVPLAVEAMKLGAVDYLQKPFDVDALEVVIARALSVSRLTIEHRFLREQQRAGEPRLGALIGRSAAMTAVFWLPTTWEAPSMIICGV